MKQLDKGTAELINKELNETPEKYQRNFNSTHEGYGVLMEEVKELEDEIFFGEKRAKAVRAGDPRKRHLANVRKEAIQVAAMAVRIIQELT